MTTNTLDNNTTRTVITYVILVSCSIMVLLPVSWVVLSSFQPGSSLFSSSFIPKGFTLQHYKDLFTETNFPMWYKNTLKVAVINMICAVLLTSMTAYVFSRFDFPGKKITMMTVLVMQMFPSFLAMVAIYIILLKLNLLDNIWGLILVYVSGQIPFNAWICKGYLDGIPRALDEAARVDGASSFTTFYKIIMPLAKPVLVLIALQNFITPWFDFIFPAIILRSPEKMTLAVGIFAWVSEKSNDNFTRFAAASILVAVPITLLFMFLQKHIVAGLSAGATKG